MLEYCLVSGADLFFTCGADPVFAGVLYKNHTKNSMKIFSHGSKVGGKIAAKLKDACAGLQR